jgi:hypothetical protein
MKKINVETAINEIDGRIVFFLVHQLKRVKNILM